MPVRGTNHSSHISDENPYFTTLPDLDNWAQTSLASTKFNLGVLPYTPRDKSEQTPDSTTRGKLLVCHDYKGGYVESPTAPSYTFNFWSSCETFIYFSHHRVTVPPSGWSTAAHRHGVKMLGTLIFEHDTSQADGLRLLVGALPRSTTGPANPATATSLPVSPHYARLLAQLAYQRGFDGYLLNFEAPLPRGVEQTRALTMWIALLVQELKRTVGSHAEAIWYDSVIVDGRVRWQDRLNSANLPLFLPSTGFFSNYTWPSPYPALSAKYLLSVDQSTLPLKKTLQDLYIGIDTWGRGSHGGGGFGLYRAISHIDPEALGLSVALFGQAWTWESEQDKPGWSWKVWWEYERKLWLGPQTAGEAVAVPPLKLRQGEPECAHRAFKPIADFFPRHPPPNPARRAFFTSFCPGVGWAWFVRGVSVLRSDTGWTDVDKTSSIGDLVFPRPTLAWEDDARDEAVPAARAELSMDDAWLGGSSLVVSLAALGSDAEDAFFRRLWLPVQSLSVTPRTSYRMSVVYKISGPVDTDVEASVKTLSQDARAAGAPDVSYFSTSLPLPGGWTELAVDFVLPLDRPAATAAPVAVVVAAGLVVGFTCADPTEHVDCSVHIGALSVSANPPSAQHVPPQPRVLWAAWHAPDAPDDRRAAPFAGTLTWGTGLSLGPVPAPTAPASPEDPTPAWVLDAAVAVPGFAYFNVYVQAHTGEGAGMPPEEAIFVGTTGLDGRENRFYVDPACVPDEVRGAGGVRFYVQGVTDRGRVLEWADCAFVDVGAMAG